MLRVIPCVLSVQPQERAEQALLGVLIEKSARQRSCQLLLCCGRMAVLSTEVLGVEHLYSCCRLGLALPSRCVAGWGKVGSGRTSNVW